MSETAKTCVFVLAGALAITSAVLFNTAARPTDTKQLVGTVLNKDIDVSAPRRLQIAKFDRATATVQQFEVAEIDGVWSIPSKDNYPADATQQMAEAATCLIDRKILRVAGDSPQTHEEFGVVDPLAAKLNSKSVGVGTHVTMTDADDALLVDMIIGKAVKDDPKQRYVRLAKQDVVYVVELDSSKLSTNFADWIEGDLLKLNTMDLRKVFVNDYSADLSLDVSSGRPTLTIDDIRRNEMTLARDADGSPWTLANILKYDPATDTMVADALAEGEEVNQEDVNALVSGLDELAIADVVRKPAGLSADLKAGEAFLNDDEGVSDLVRKGFIPGRQESGADMLSSEGEVVCTQRNGVEYVLRFGQLQVHAEHEAAEEFAEEDAAAAAAATGAQPAADGENLRRYLFVMARFNEDAVEKPVYKELPPLPPEESAEEQAEAEAEGGETAGEATEAPAVAGEAATADAASDEAATAETPADDGEAATEEGDAAAVEGEGDASKNREAIIAERTRIEEENAHAREEYEALISSGQEEEKSLNARFGDWYFVISNDVFKKIHLGRGQVVKPKDAAPAEGEATAPDATSGLPDLGGFAVPPAPGQ